MVVSVVTSLANVDYLRFKESATPSTPAAGKGLLYIKSDGLLYTMDDAGLETGPITNAAAIILNPASDVRNIIEPAADFIPLIVRGSAAAQTKQIFVAQEGSGDTEVFSLSGTGEALFQNFTDSTTGFRILDKDGGTAILTADTTNERIGLGVAPSYPFHVAKTNTTVQNYSNYFRTSYTPSAPEASPDNNGMIIYTTKDGATLPTGSPSLGALYLYASLDGAGDYATLRAGYVAADNNSTGALTSAYGLYYESINNWDAGSIVTATQAYFADQTDATNNYNIYTNAGNTVFNAANGAGNITFGATPVSAHYDVMLAGQGVLGLKETTTPTADAGYGKLYTKADNGLYFQDGAGNEHLAHSTAFGNVWFHGASTEVTISAADVFAQVDTFAIVGSQDELSNVVGSAATDDLTLAAGAGGKYNISFGSSIANAGAAVKEMVLVPGVTLNTALDITNVTDDTVSPIVITSVAHGLNNGDMVTIENVAVNTAANGDFVVANKANDTFEIVDLSLGATTGNGDYDEGTPTGDITIWYPGALVTHRDVSNTAFGVTAHSAPVTISGGDVVGLYVANLDDGNNLSVISVSLTINRFDI